MSQPRFRRIYRPRARQLYYLSQLISIFLGLRRRPRRPSLSITTDITHPLALYKTQDKPRLATFDLYSFLVRIRPQSLRRTFCYFAYTVRSTRMRNRHRSTRCRLTLAGMVRLVERCFRRQDSNKSHPRDGRAGIEAIFPTRSASSTWVTA